MWIKQYILLSSVTNFVTPLSNVGYPAGYRSGNTLYMYSVGADFECQKEETC